MNTLLYQKHQHISPSDTLEEHKKYLS